MKKNILIKLVVISILFLFSAGISAKDSAKELNINSIELKPPVPAIPFYHFVAQVELPEPSIIEVKAEVNGKVLRFTDLHKHISDDDLNYPALTHRPPSGYGLSEDGTLYQNFDVVGWVKWQPGEKYTIKLTVRIKKDIKASDNDTWLTKTETLNAPENMEVFDPAWKNFKSVVVSETAGIERKSEPVEVLLPFYPDEAFDLKREIRVVAVDPETYHLSEVPSQVYDIQKYTEEDDMAPDENGKPNA